MSQTTQPTPPKPVKVQLARRCKYCRATFVPEHLGGKEAKFCCPNHRKAFWRYGGLPFDKMFEQVWRKIKHELPGLVHAEIERLGVSTQTELLGAARRQQDAARQEAIKTLDSALASLKAKESMDGTSLRT